MANPFVSYLNTLHNEQASNQNAIGESQIGTGFFMSTQVKRPMIEFLKEKIAVGAFVILTGHAGDGKTTLLAQVIEAMGVKCTNLEKIGQVDASEVSLHYVKDFSELTQAQQDAELTFCFSSKSASLLIANTGPLIGCFSRLYGKSYESILLDAMDDPAGQEVTIGSSKCYILNIARVDNTDFIRPYIHNLITDEHWACCVDCPKATVCPIYYNRELLSTCENHAATFIENAYIWLQEYDNRATIRQITAHLSYSITGGLSCDWVWKHAKHSTRYRYLISNLFFGSTGNGPNVDAQQIRGIQLLTQVGFDRCQTSMDYSLFIKHELRPHFPDMLADLLEETLQRTGSNSRTETQCVLKRAYILFGQNTQEEEKKFISGIFSEWYCTYLAIRKGLKEPDSHLREDICRAIDILFTGEVLQDNPATINLTLRRNNEQLCIVQLLQGRINIDDVRLRRVPVRSFDPETQKRYQIELHVNDVAFPIGLPLLNYFCEIKNGVILTDIDPLLSNGIDSLKAQLLSANKLHLEPNEAALIYLKGTEWRKRTLRINGHHIEN